MVTRKNDNEPILKGFNLVDLEEKDVPALKKVASAMGLEDQEIDDASKHHLVFKILEAQAKKQGLLFSEGVLECLEDGFGFLRAPEFSYLPSQDDIYVSPSQIRKFQLRTGDTILGVVRAPKNGEKYFALIKIEELQARGDWAGLGRRMGEWGKRLEAAGADGLVICTNTMHRLADEVARAVRIPLIHIADATATAIKGAGLSTVGLLGTRYTMELDFYRGRLEKAHGLKVLIPEEPGRTAVHDIIYRELAYGQIREESRQVYIEVIRDLVGRGAEGVILGCTEISLLVKPADSPVPVFDTTALHAAAAVDFALAD